MASWRWRCCGRWSRTRDGCDACCLMDTILVLFTLAIRSSYSRNLEVDATESEFDTVQFFCSGGDSWRIKTYAMDEDVHAWNIGKVEDLVALARTNTEKHYGDVLA